MALLFCDGFDHYATADILKKWDLFGGGSMAIGGSYGRNGTAGILFTTDGVSPLTSKYILSNPATIIVGMAINPPAVSNFNSSWGFIRLRDSDTDHLILYHGGDGSLAVYRAGTSLGSASAGTLPAGVFSYVEFKATINDTTGSIEVRVNGRTVISASGIDTKNSANAYVNRVAINGAGNSGNTLIDDLYICDTTGSTNNDFLGEIRIKTVMPTAEGTNSAWTPLSGTDNALMVDEASQDGDTTYNYTDTLNARDTHAIADIASLGGAVYGVAVNVMARKEGDVVRKIKPVIKSSATYSLGAEATLLSSYMNAQAIYETDPNGSVVWTETTVNAMEAGVDLTA